MHIVFSYHEFRELCVFREGTGDWCEMTISAIENVAADFMIPGHRVIWDQGSRGPAPPRWSPLSALHYSMSNTIVKSEVPKSQSQDQKDLGWHNNHMGHHHPITFKHEGVLQ